MCTSWPLEFPCPPHIRVVNMEILLYYIINLCLYSSIFKSDFTFRSSLVNLVFLSRMCNSFWTCYICDAHLIGLFSIATVAENRGLAVVFAIPDSTDNVMKSMPVVLNNCIQNSCSYFLRIRWEAWYQSHSVSSREQLLRCLATAPGQEIVRQMNPHKMVNWCFCSLFFVVIKQTRYSMLITKH